MWLNNHHWHFDYVRLARDTGFTFEKTKSPLDKNKICLIDLVKIIGERDVGTIELFIPSIVHYSIDTGDHTGILDQNFLKIFRMSQLAVEYLLFCKTYLDHTVTLLKEEMKGLKEENKELKIFNDELKQHTDVLLEKLKSEHNTYSFKCSKCSKAFSTEQYLIAHMERRHSDYYNLGGSELDIEMEIKEIKQKLNNTEKLMKNEELNPKLEDSLNKNYSKMGSALKNLEIQMQALLEKLQEVETKNAIVQEDKADTNVGSMQKNEEMKTNLKLSNDKKPQLIQVQHKVYGNVEKLPAVSKLCSVTTFDDSDKVDTFEEKSQEHSRSVTVKSVNITNEIEEIFESEDETSKLSSKPEFSADVILEVSPCEITRGKSSSTLGKRSVTSLRKASLISEVKGKFRKEMEQVFEERLAGLGLSLEWKGIPEQTYLRVMDILNHQSTLMQKTYPDYKSIRKKLIKTMNDECDKKTSKKELENTKKVRKPKMKSASLKSSTSQHSILSIRKPESAPEIEIKNRTIFDTDSSSSENVPQRVRSAPTNQIRRSKPYSAVIEELKESLRADKNLSAVSHGDTADSLRTENQTCQRVDLQTKGVLKTFSTSGPVPKKRVFFNLKNNSRDQREFLEDVDGSNTTSIASSVLDISEGDSSSPLEKNRDSDMKKDIEDLSDSDFSIFDDSNRKKVDV